MLPHIHSPHVPVGSDRSDAAVTIAIIDSGIDLTHAELSSHLARDATGAIVSRDFVTPGPVTGDLFGHGTHVAALTGRLLLARRVDFRLVPVRVLGPQGRGSRSALARAIRWAADRRAQVINMSMTFLTYDRDVDDAVQYAWEQGAVLVAAAGNTGQEEPVFPAGLLHVVGVAAADGSGRPWGRTTRGSHVLLAAPGVRQASAIPSGAALSIGHGKRGLLSGSSAASAHVAAAAAVLRARHPARSNSALVAALVRIAAQAGAPWDRRIGYGVLRTEHLSTAALRVGATLNLQLLSADGVPLRGFSVRLHGRRFTSDEAGVVRIHDLPPGAGRIWLEGEGQSLLPAYIDHRLHPGEVAWRRLIAGRAAEPFWT